MMEDKSLSVRDRLDAMEFIRRCSGIDRQKHPQRKRTGFKIVRAPAADMVDAAPRSPPASRAKAVPGAPPRKRAPPPPARCELRESR
jgi:hypothetical protein